MKSRSWGVVFTDAPYMGAAERGEFKRLRDAGAVTVFGIAICAASGCEHEVPRGRKLYCSLACWRKEEGGADEEAEEASGSMD